MIPTPLTPAARTQRPEMQTDPGEAPGYGLLWVDQLAEELLLTVQAFQRLHAAMQGKMTGP